MNLFAEVEGGWFIGEVAFKLKDKEWYDFNKQKCSDGVVGRE